jgi:hypothetical protein
MMRHAQHVPERALLGDVDAEQLRNLIERDDHSDARLEASERWGRNQVCDKAKPKDSSSYVNGPRCTATSAQKNVSRHALAATRADLF